MKKIYLHGKLQKFGKVFNLDILSPKEGIHALCTQLKGFKKEFLKGNYFIFKGNMKEKNSLDLEELNIGLGKQNEFHIMPTLKGAKHGGLGKVLAGIAIITLAVYAAPAAATLGAELGQTAFLGVTYGNIALFGAGIALGGIAELLSPTPKISDYSDRNSPDQRASFLFNGAVNSTEQGVPVPLLFGRMRIGSTVVSAGLDLEQL